MSTPGPAPSSSVDVSIVMPAYCAAQTLPRAVASVQAQSFASWELIIVDDASPDDTLDVARRLAAAEPRTVVLAQTQNSGAARARNVAIAQARGRYIAFLDADDTWAPEKLAVQIAYMQAHGAAFSCTAYYRGDGTTWWQTHVPARADHAALLANNTVGCLTAVYDSTMLGRVMMPDMRLRQDYALWLDLLRRTPHVHGIDTPLAYHYRAAGSLSANPWRAAMGTWRLYRQHENLGIAASVRYLSLHLGRRLFRTWRRPADPSAAQGQDTRI